MWANNVSDLYVVHQHILPVQDICSTKNQRILLPVEDPLVENKNSIAGGVVSDIVVEALRPENYLNNMECIFSYLSVFLII